jgi:hypothetical protein
MKYYAIKGTNGKYWNGAIKLCSPPILICNATEKGAFTLRKKQEMGNIAKKSAKHDKYEVVEIDSVNYPHLAN